MPENTIGSGLSKQEVLEHNKSLSEIKDEEQVSFEDQYPEQPPQSFLSEEADEVESFLLFAQNPLFTQILWSRLEAGRIRREQALEDLAEKDPKMAEDARAGEEADTLNDKKNFEKLLVHPSREEVEADRKFELWLIHYVKGVARHMFEIVGDSSPKEQRHYIKNPELLKLLGDCKNVDDLISRIFHHYWEIQRFKGFPKQEPMNPYWPDEGDNNL